MGAEHHENREKAEDWRHPIREVRCGVIEAKGEVTIEGEVERVTFENHDTGFRVLKLAVEGRRDRLPVVGTFPPVAAGVRLRIRGTFAHDPKHGEQLRAESVTELAPSTLVGIERYLGSGMIPGIGEKYAARIVGVFGLDTLRVLDEVPDRLNEVDGLGKKRIAAIAKAWRDQRAIREVMVFLQAHGASPSLATRIFKRYGAGAVNVVSNNPYRLALDVWGIGFKTADKIAGSLGVARDSAQRLQAGVLQTMHDVTEAGHAYASEDDLIDRAGTMLEVDVTLSNVRADLANAVHALVIAQHLVVELSHGVRIAFGTEMFNAETRLASRIAEMMRERSPALEGATRAIDEFEARANLELAPEQRDAVTRAASEGMLVVTGGPGVGKTTIVRAILAVFDRANLAVKLAAPTGRAAKRMTEATGREASTLHRLLEFDPKNGGFKRDRNHPLNVGAIIVDEVSMVDAFMADALTQAIPKGARVVFVGDVDQLASVGPGSFLRDLIVSDRVPCVRLARIFRQSKESLIVTNAHRINDGKAPEAPEAGDTSSDFFVIERRDPEAALKTIIELVSSRIPRRFGFDPRRDVQVLTPMNRGACGSVALNEHLQAALNPTGPSITHGARIFRVGDKVMQLRNDYDRNVWNGDVGIITSVDGEDASLVVRFDDSRDVPYDRGSLDDLNLAYACTIHKSQGSEYNVVVVPLLTSHFVMLSKNLLYTAVTRGKRLVVLVCDPRAVSLALAADRKDERKTRLAERIQLAAGAR
jgi:exodeoxyribonuclease V alpha subunit